MATRTSPIQNPYFKRTRNMTPAVTGRSHLGVKRNEPSHEVDEVQYIKSPWFRRVLKRIGKK